MPELMENAVLFAVLAAILSRFIPIRQRLCATVPSGEAC